MGRIDMFNLLRIVVTLGWLFLMYRGIVNARDNPDRDLVNAFYVAAVVVGGLVASAFWTPYLAEGICGSLTGSSAK